MKKFIYLLLILTLVGCSKSKNVDIVRDYSNEVSELNLKIDTEKYIEAFNNYINGFDVNSDLITHGIANAINIDFENIDDFEPDEVTEEDELGIPNENELNELEQAYEPQEYPIWDIKGNIIGWGTKEESNESYEIYEKQPEYETQSADFYIDTIIFKVWCKSLKTIQIYEVKLNSDMQMDSVILMNTM